MDAIGGYFELELRHGEHYHKDAIRLNTARNCFEYVLIARKYRKVYIPYYTCEVMLQPLRRQHVKYAFYSIDWNLEPVETFNLKEGEAILYTNYFGLKQDCVERLAKVYGSRLIVDNAQAFYAPRIDGIDTFYSPRKFFGVPDGGYLYTDCRMEGKLPQDKSNERMQHLLVRIENGAEAGYKEFKKAEDSLDNQSIMCMSEISDRILRQIDYDYIKKIRRTNFQVLHDSLSDKNRLHFLTLLDNTVPMAYPYFSDNAGLRNALISKRIFVATYWPNIFEWCKPDSIEYRSAQGIIPMPIDQRYDYEYSNYLKLIIR